jgi:hypothetical protein
LETNEERWGSDEGVPSNALNVETSSRRRRGLQPADALDFDPLCLSPYLRPPAPQKQAKAMAQAKG